MARMPKYCQAGLSPWEFYRLRHRHPLNRLTHVFGIPGVAASVGYPLYMWFTDGIFAWRAMLVLAAIGWGLQFLGHAIEGNRPAFMADPRHFLVGPLYIFGVPVLRVCQRLRGGAEYRHRSEGDSIGSPGGRGSPGSTMGTQDG